MFFYHERALALLVADQLYCIPTRSLGCSCLAVWWPHSIPSRASTLGRQLTTTVGFTCQPTALGSASATKPCRICWSSSTNCSSKTLLYASWTAPCCKCSNWCELTATR